MNFYLYFPHLLSSFYEIQHETCSVNVFERVCVRHCRLGCSVPVGINYIYVCTLRMYDVLEVRNALVKSVYSATEYTVFGRHHCLLSTFILYRLLQPLQGSERRGCVSSLPPAVGYVQVIRHGVRRECGSKAWAKQQSNC